MKQPDVSLVVPVHNQGDHVTRTIEGYLEALRRLPQETEVILVPNACTDDSVVRCRRLAAAHPEVTTVELADGGWGRAVKAGLREARGTTLAYTNSARTTPSMLTLMLAYAAAYPNVVLKANRRIRDNWRRRLGSVLYNLECRALFDLPTWDINGTPKVFPRSFERLMRLGRDDDLIDAEFALVCSRNSYPVVEVPILATERHGGKSTTNYQSALRMYWGAYKLAREVP
jgi:dolichol-phosphate mannosyltransferase